MQQLYGQFSLFSHSPCFLWRTFSFVCETWFIWSLRRARDHRNRLTGINSTAFILFSTTDHFTSQYISLTMWPDHPHEPLVHTQSFCSWSLKLLSSEKRNKVRRARGEELTSFAAPFIESQLLLTRGSGNRSQLQMKGLFPSPVDKNEAPGHSLMK